MAVALTTEKSTIPSQIRIILIQMRKLQVLWALLNYIHERRRDIVISLCSCATSSTCMMVLWLYIVHNIFFYYVEAMYIGTLYNVYTTQHTNRTLYLGLNIKYVLCIMKKDTQLRIYSFFSVVLLASRVLHIHVNGDCMHVGTRSTKLLILCWKYNLNTNFTWWLIRIKVS